MKKVSNGFILSAKNNVVVNHYKNFYSLRV